MCGGVKCVCWVRCVDGGIVVCVWLPTSEKGQGPWKGKEEAIEPAVLTLLRSDNSFLKIFSHNLVAFKPSQQRDSSLAKIPTWHWRFKSVRRSL